MANRAINNRQKLVHRQPQPVPQPVPAAKKERDARKRKRGAPDVPAGNKPRGA